MFFYIIICVSFFTWAIFVGNCYARYPADKGHQDYYNRNKSSNGYCRLVIHPKLSKVRHLRPHPTQCFLVASFDLMIVRIGSLPWAPRFTSQAL